MAIDTSTQDRFIDRMRRDGEYPTPEPAASTCVHKDAPKHECTTRTEQLGLFGVTR